MPQRFVSQIHIIGIFVFIALCFPCIFLWFHVSFIIYPFQAQRIGLRICDLVGDFTVFEQKWVIYCKDVVIGRQTFLFSGVYCSSSVLDVKGLHQGSMRVNNINYYCFKHDSFGLNLLWYASWWFSMATRDFIESENVTWKLSSIPQGMSCPLTWLLLCFVARSSSNKPACCCLQIEYTHADAINFFH